MVEFDDLWDYSKPGETEEKFLSVLEDVKSKQDLSSYIQLLTQIARSQGLQFRFKDAHDTLDESERLLDSSAGNIEIPRVRYMLERGRVYNTSGEKDKARELFLKAYELALGNNLDFFTIDAAHMLGIVTAGKESLRWNETAIDLIEKTEDERSKKWLGPLYNNTAWTFHDMKEYDKALDLFEKNVRWHEDKKSGQGLIIAKWCVARTLRSLGRTAEALQDQLNLLDEVKLKSLQEDGFIYEEIGECLLLSGEAEKSKEYFNKAYELLSVDKWLQENEKERLERIKSLGNDAV